MSIFTEKVRSPRFSLPVVGCVLGLSAAWASAAPARPSPAMNVVLIVVDDLGWADLACYGADLHHTPHIDRLARQGVRFTAAYAAAPVCSPTRASIMTGKYPARLHMTVWYEASQNPPQDRKLLPPKTVGNLPHAEVTIAEVLHAAGYLTAHVGKWHLGDAAHYPESQGFDINIGGTFWGAPPTYFYPFRGRWSRSTEFRYVPDLPWGHEGQYLTDRLTDEALAIIRRAKDGPFFLHMAYHTVHTPIEGKPDLVQRYANRVSPAMQHHNPTYAAMVHSLDENVGRILTELDQLGIAEHTLVVLTSDNGGYINQYHDVQVTSNRPLRSGKGSLYEGGIRIPLIVRWPGVTAGGATCDQLVLTTDLYPTVLQITGMTDSAGRGAALDGRSMVPLLEKPQTEVRREAVFWHYPHYYHVPRTTPVSAVRDGDWKLIEFLEDGHVELYNLRDDLGEANELSRSQPERAAQLRDRLHRWRKSVGAQMPVPNPRCVVLQNAANGP